ncbi:MAG: sarcosine oxidase subunit delta [Desulfobacterales bacterium]|nr:sarcosine oxidase subunit delta [Desulfobacterales bacterium]
MSLLITCPICGKRNGYEFKFGGEDRGPKPNEDELTSRKWCEYTHMNTNIGGIQKEWWYHRDGCNTWFTIYRNTLTNEEVQNHKEVAP